jgi:hypothetical protein
MKKIEVWTRTTQETEGALARLTSAYGNGQIERSTIYRNGNE